MPADSQSSAQTPNTRVGLNATKIPPSAGPATIAVCDAEVEPAMARGNTLAGTNRQYRLQARLLEARPVPTMKAMANKKARREHPVDIGERKNPDRESLDNLAEESDNAPVVAIGDVTGEEETLIAGRNCTRPISPNRRAVGQLVDLPADCDDLDVQRQVPLPAHKESAESRDGVRRRERVK